MAEAFLGLGANLGDPARTIADALRSLPRRCLTVEACSGFYRTPPWGVTDQPDFVNLCARVATDLPPRALLAVTQGVEAEFGRVRERVWGPRTLDIDILAYDDLVVDEPGLSIPHPRMTERAFVLVPLAEIAPDLAVAGRSVREWAAACDPSGITRLDQDAGYLTLQP